MVNEQTVVHQRLKRVGKTLVFTFPESMTDNIQLREDRRYTLNIKEEGEQQ